MIYQDTFGRDIQVGDFIVYPARHGSVSFLHLGVVRELTMWGKTYHPVSAIRVTKADKDFKNMWKVGNDNVYVTALSKTLIVPAELVPEEVKRLFNP